MDGIEKIIERVFNEARDEAEKIKAQGAQKAAQIAERARAEAKEKSDLIFSQGKEKAVRQKELLVRVAELDSRKNLLAARQQMIDEAFRAAIERIKALPKEQYIQFLADLASGAAPLGRGELLLCAKDRDEIGSEVIAAANAKVSNGALTLSQETCPGSGGLIVRDGEADMNCSFDTLVRLSRARLSAEVSQILFA